MSRTLPRLAPRASDAHKGDFGRALLIGGSRGMAGAIALAGMSCLRSGAGLTVLAVPECILDTVAGFEPSFMTLPLACDADGRIGSVRENNKRLHAVTDAFTCISCGPGLSRSEALVGFVVGLYELLPQPMIIDADGLNALAAADEGLAKHAGPRILTPHPGEFARLAKYGDDEKPSRDEQIKRAQELASENQIVIVLKGHRTIITDGQQTAENTTGNPGMATGGTGDVLTGIITALICQGLSPFDAAVLATHVHGLAGDLAAKELGQVSLIASDLLKYLPAAFQSLAPSIGD
jgi:ADP-dependent NAD(P)H-hydrate dehydratase